MTYFNSYVYIQHCNRSVLKLGETFLITLVKYSVGVHMLLTVAAKALASAIQ